MINRELMNNTEEKEKYKVFCSKCYVPIFSQPWWMDSVCGEQNWGVHVLEKSGQYLGAMPYYVETRNGFDIVTKAHHTQNNGIIMNYPANSKYVTKLSNDEKVVNEMCDYIEKLNPDKYEQQFHYDFTNWLPFRWRGYSQDVRYTYVIEDTSDLEAVESGYTDKIRNEIKKAERVGIRICEDDMDIETFYEINKCSYDRQGIDVPFSLKLFERIDNACKEQECKKLLYALDKQGNIVSVTYLVWDDRSVYYLINGTNPDFKSSQANALLIRESIRLAHKLNKSFDFEGSVIQPIEHIFRAYGAVQKPYFRIFKSFNPNMDENLVNSWAKDAPIF